jgi:hypothetical protein
MGASGYLWLNIIDINRHQLHHCSPSLPLASRCLRGVHCSVNICSCVTDVIKNGCSHTVCVRGSVYGTGCVCWSSLGSLYDNMLLSNCSSNGNMTNSYGSDVIMGPEERR